MTGSSREFYGTGTNFLRYRYRYFFPGPIFSGTGTGTFFRDQIFSVPVPVLFSGTKFFRYQYRYFFSGTNFFRYRDRYLQKGAKFPGPGIPGTGMSHSAVMKCDMYCMLVVGGRPSGRWSGFQWTHTSKKNF